MSEASVLRQILKEKHKDFRKEIREAENAWALTRGVLYTCEFEIASIKLTKAATKLLMTKIAQIGTVLAFKAELMALENGKKVIDKKTMKKVLDALDTDTEKEALQEV